MMPDIRDMVWQATAKRRKKYKSANNTASQLGFPCLRYLVYRRTAPLDLVPLPDVGLQFVFEQGDAFHDLAETQLRKAGFKIHYQEQTLDMPQFQELRITGRMDLAISHEELWGHKARLPVEVKSMNPFDWAKLDSYEDMVASDKPWLRKYPGQMQLYLLMAEKELGIFYIVNKLNGQPKVIWVHLDYGYCEELLQKAEAVNKHVDERTVPDRIEWDDMLCGRCDYRGPEICNAGEYHGEGAHIVTDKEWIEKVETWYDLKAEKKAYDALDKQIKAKVKDVPCMIFGDIEITGKASPRKGHTVEPTIAWLTKARRLGG
jgi:hypothetical protein